MRSAIFAAPSRSAGFRTSSWPTRSATGVGKPFGNWNSAAEILLKVRYSLAALKGGLPAAIWYRTQPKDHRSAAQVTSSFSSVCSRRHRKSHQQSQPECNPGTQEKHVFVVQHLQKHHPDAFRQAANTFPFSRVCQSKASIMHAGVCSKHLLGLQRLQKHCPNVFMHLQQMISQPLASAGRNAPFHSTLHALFGECDQGRRNRCILQAPNPCVLWTHVQLMLQ